MYNPWLYPVCGGGLSRMNANCNSEKNGGANAVQERVCHCPYCGREFNVGERPPEHRSVCCKRCGYVWNLRKSEPKKCPNCGSTNWNSEVGTYVCKRCSHTWTSRKGAVPRKCPKCQTLLWNKEPASVSHKEKKEHSISAEREEKIIDCHSKGMGLFETALSLNLPALEVLGVYTKHGWV